jgi:TatD DNase family protein
MIVDTHCHLDYLDKPLDVVKAEAKLLGVERFLTISVEESHWHKLLEYGCADDVDVALGIHPCDIHKAKLGWEERLLSLAAQDSVVAIGETGLDYYHDTTHKKQQIQAFLSHIEIATSLKKPIVVHMRSSKEDVMPIIEKANAFGIMHCFSEDYDTAKRAIDAGFLISFSGVITFNSALALKEVAKKIPLESMLVETDAPFLTPVPYRGKKNYPGYVYYVAKKISELRGISLESLSEQTTKNYLSLIA